MEAIIACILQFIDVLDVEVYLVGGSIRDILLNKKVKDIDLIVSKKVEIVARKIAEGLKGSLVELDSQRQTYRIVLKEGLMIDVTVMQGDTVNEDLYHRDFTINAMAYNLRNGWPMEKEKIIDPYNGKIDLKKRQIRHINEQTFLEDPLRMIRAVRFMTQLKFDIQDETIEIIRKNAETIKKVAGERITTELFGILKENRAYYYLSFMDKHLNLLDKIFPEVKKMKNIGECKYHVVDCWTHSIYTVKVAENVIYAHGFFEDHIRKAYEDHTSEMIAADRSRLQLVKLGALFHDIGKPSARKVDSKGRVRFRGHEITGAEIIKTYADQLKLSAREKEILYRYIVMHMAPLVSYKGNDVSGKVLYEMFKEMQEETLDILLIAFADIVATRKLLNPQEEMGMFKVHIEYIANNYLTRYQPLQDLSSYITGKEIMEMVGIPEGQRVGEILEEIKQAIYFGEISFSRRSILDYLEFHYQK